MAVLLHTALFIVALTLIFFIVYMIHYASIQSSVRNQSRCLRAKLMYTADGQYTVKAVDEGGKDLYKLDYDMTAKEVKHECACPKGDVINHFEKVKYQDLKTNTEREISDMMCGCDAAYDAVGQDIFYEGHPGLVRYMQNGDASFFTSDINGIALKQPTAVLRNVPTQYAVTAYTAAPGNAPTYSVTYDAKTLQSGKGDVEPYRVSCACPIGDKAVTYSAKVYNKSAQTVTVQKACKCASQDQPTAYKGTSGLVDFMTNGTATFFNSIKQSA
jgi:hypothetical protein